MFSPGFRLFMGFAGFGLLTAFFYAVVTGDGGGADTSASSMLKFGSEQQASAGLEELVTTSDMSYS